jgi:hypothetical protein
MTFSFTATIYKVGINPCVSVPHRITSKMTAVWGYIPVKGRIMRHLFLQTLVPVKNKEYRLYVNALMLKGAGAKMGDTVRFTISQDRVPRTADQIAMPEEFKKELGKNKLMPAFKKLTPYRQKEILRYLNHLKTGEALAKNIRRVVDQLKEKDIHSR